MVQLTLFAEDIRQPARPVRSDIRSGDAAEAFVIAKLLKAGFNAHGARRDAPYDIGVDLGKGRYCRVQVKGRERAHRGKWDFRFVRGNPRTGAGAYAYTATDFDITACVSLSLERVAFFSGVHASIRLSTADFLRPDGEIDSWNRALNVFNRKGGPRENGSPSGSHENDLPGSRAVSDSRSQAALENRGELVTTEKI